MRHGHLLRLLLALLAITAAPLVVHASTATDARLGPTCSALAAADISDTTDAPAQITEARLIFDKGDSQGYCQITGYVAPAITFVLRMPAQGWNGKLLQLGCAGYCGSTEHIAQCDRHVQRGYACIVNDGGHRASNAQALWAFNNWEAQIDYFVRATHVTVLLGKTLVQRHYGRAAARSYFMGCSAGGREALIEAQKFPWDFDGLVAGCPSISQTGIRLSLLWSVRALSAPSGEPLLAQEDYALLHAAVVSKCDLNDGVRDGLIGDPRQCHFNPEELLCKSSRSKGCLSRTQVDAVRKVYEGPRTSSGEQIYFPGALRGSEQTWGDWFRAPPGSALHNFLQDAFRYYAFHPSPGPSWMLENFDFDRDYRRIALSDGLFASSNPDLRAFARAGGKLLVYTGWSDAAGIPLAAVDYYETAERIWGGRSQTQEFFRLFVIPGMNHCVGGDGPYVIDYLGYLERWVEQGQPPTSLIGYSVLSNGPKDAGDLLARRIQYPPDPATVRYSRPVYPYPLTATYAGSGDPATAENFRPDFR